MNNVEANKENQLPKEVVIVSDCALASDLTDDPRCATLDKVKVEEAFQLKKNISRFVDKVVIVSDLEDLTKWKNNKNCLIYPYRNSSNSRNRQVLVQSFCESLALPFVGADAFARFLCADKALAKNIIEQAGLTTSAHLRIDTIEDLNKGCNLNFPVVVKPNNEDSSVGITEHSICYNWDDAKILGASLLKDFKGSVLVEEFVSGKEVYVCILKKINGELSIAYAERQLDGDPNYFKNNLFTGHIKRLKTKLTRLIQCNSLVLDNQEEFFIDVFNRIGSLVSLRIDGRLTNERFTVLELTTSPNLNETAEYLSAFRIGGKAPESVIKSIIQSAWKRHLLIRGQ